MVFDIDKIMWRIPSRVAEMYREKSRIVDEIADAIPAMADKLGKVKEELAQAQSKYDLHVDLKERLEKSAQEIGYSIDWEKKAIIKG